MLKRWIALLCLLSLSLTCLPCAALATSDLYTDSIVLQPLPDQGVSHYSFVCTGDKSGWFSSNKVELEIKAGRISVEAKYKDAYKDGAYYAYPPMEATIWRWDIPSRAWVEEDNYDIYNEHSKTIKLKEDHTYYCIQLYFWRPVTVADSYSKHRNLYTYSGAPISVGKAFTVTDAHWSDREMPTVTVTPDDEAIMYTFNPMGVYPQEQPQ